MGGEKDQKAKNIQIGSIESNSSKISEIDMLMNKLRGEIKERQEKLTRLAKLKEKIINEEKTKQKK